MKFISNWISRFRAGLRLIAKFFIFFIVITPLAVYAFDKPIILPPVYVHPTHATSLSSKQEKSRETIVINREQIEKSPVIDLGQLLREKQSIVRITNNSGNPSQTALSIRGFGDNAAANSLILVDGFPLINFSLLTPNFNSIPLTDIERLEIIQGSEGVLYGNQAVGGVLNIITKQPKKWTSSAIVSIGNFDTNNMQFFIADKFSNGIVFKTFGVLGNTRNYREHNRQTVNNVAVQLGYDYMKGIIRFNTQYYNNNTLFPGPLFEQQMQLNPRQASDFESFSYYETLLIQLLNKHEYNADWLIETRISHQDTNSNGLIKKKFTRNEVINSLSERIIGHIDGSKLIFGYDGLISQFTLKNIDINPRAFAKQNDLYFQGSLPLANRVDAIIGARYAWQTNAIDGRTLNTVNLKNKAWVTEEGFLFHPTRELSFYLRRSGSFTFPKANQIMFMPSQITDLHTQMGISYETGATFENDKQKAQLSLYRLALNSEIAFDPQQSDDHPYGLYSNLDSSLRYGVTATEQIYITKSLDLNGQINYVDARFVSGCYSGKLIPAVPAINANAAVHYKWQENWQMQYALLYTGSRYPSEDLANVRKKLSPYWLSDISIQYFLKYVNVSLTMHNIFNKQYQGYAYYNLFSNAVSYYPAAGRNYTLSVKLNID